jgi:hypothetical protein
MADKLHPGTQIYDLEYFSGSQMFLYVGDVWIDEITSLQYQHIQEKTPLYGYASQLADDFAAGHVIVQGAFTINFKEQGYLWAVLRRYKNMDINTALASTSGGKDLSGLDKYLLSSPSNAMGDTDRRPTWGSNVNKTQRLSIERIAQGELTRGQAYDFYHDLAGYSTFDTTSPRDKVFENIVESFEDQIWAKGISDNDLRYQVRSPTDNLFDDFDMYVVHGNYSQPAANHTVQKIIGVRLTSQGKMIKIDGEPTQESYQFLAQTTA